MTILANEWHRHYDERAANMARETVYDHAGNELRESVVDITQNEECECGDDVDNAFCDMCGWTCTVNLREVNEPRGALIVCRECAHSLGLDWANLSYPS